MTTLILRTIQHFWRQNLSLALDVAVSTAVITGALIVGDSMQYSLQRIVALRLGDVTHTISAGDRFFTDSLAVRLESTLGIPCAPLLQLAGSAAAPGGQYRLPRVQILGIDDRFAQVTDRALPTIKAREAWISENLAVRLNLQTGDELLLRIRSLSVLPPNAPFVSEAGNITPVIATVAGILREAEMGRFQLQHIQSAPFNVFLSLDFLDEAMAGNGMISHVLISASDEVKSSDIESALAHSWRPADLNLSIRWNDRQNDWELTSDRVFIDPPIQLALQLMDTPKEFVLTYFVNQLAVRDRQTPYSFVSTLPETKLPPGRIIINEWLAEDLAARPGDTLSLRYYIIGPLRELMEHSADFTVAGIVPMEDRWTDPNLMPTIPGLSDVGNCRDWETGVPVDLTQIRNKDEDYWDQYRGAPKAYLSYPDARQLWQNRFGASTLIRFPADRLPQAELEEHLQHTLDPFQLGFQVDSVLEEAVRAAAGGVDFSQLFLGLSFFLVLASLLLTVLLFSLNAESRMSQLGTLATLGFTDRQINAILLGESGVIAVLGSAAGLLLAIGYNRAVFDALNSIWSAIVRTPNLTTAVYPATLLAGFGISLAVSLSAIYGTLRRLLRQQAHALQTETIRQQRSWPAQIQTTIMYLSGGGALLLVGWAYLQGAFQHAGLFFAGGGLLLIALLLFLYRLLQQPLRKIPEIGMTTPRLIRQNITRNHNRSFLVIALFAIGTFIVIATGMNRRDAFTTALQKDSGTGGFLFFAESTVPVLRNLNDPAERFEAGLEGDYPVLQLRTVQGDDASCLNLNRVSAPTIWGLRPEAMSGRFRFIRKTEELDDQEPWRSLKEPLDAHTIPAIADQTVIQWGLGLQVGDTLHYVDEHGEPLGLKLIGGLANSIFQGSVLIDENLLLRHFPSSSGSNIFLIDGDPAAAEDIRSELEFSFRDHGWDMQATADRLATFNSVENTYLSIFMILGSLGLIIGTIGLGIVLARNLLGRRHELGVLLTLGYEKSLIERIVNREHFYLLLWGIGIGILTASLASLPSWLRPHPEVSPASALILTGLIFLTGLGCILLFSRWFLREAELIEAVRED